MTVRPQRFSEQIRRVGSLEELLARAASGRNREAVCGGMCSNYRVSLSQPTQSNGQAAADNPAASRAKKAYWSSWLAGLDSPWIL